MDKKLLLEHHLQFLSTHRGKRKTFRDAEYISSDKSFFNIAFPLSESAINTIDPGFKLYLPDWVSNESSLNINRKNLFELTYMTLPGLKPEWSTLKGLIIRKAVSPEDIEDFSLVQGRGFTANEAEFEEWHNWMKPFNMKNLEDENQNFYTAYENNKPVGVCLCIIHQKCAGIYAVATLPEFRKKGISTSVMSHAIENALHTGIDEVTLQVETDSYAHSFYRKLGFNDAFKRRVYDSAS